MWSILETDFGDETANFGPRRETGTALFQLDTIATVSCEDQENTLLPQNVSSVLGDLTAMAVDKSLVVHSSTILSFESQIEEVEWSPDGSLIIVGTTSGILYVLDAESTEIIFSINFVPEERKVNGRSFRRILFADVPEEEGTGELVILTADGQLIVQQDVEVFKKGGDNIGQAVKENICMGSTGDQHSTVHDMVIRGDFIYTLGAGENILAKWNFRHGGFELEDVLESLFNGAHFIQGTGTTDGHYLFLLNSNHHVGIWDAETLVCLRHFEDLVVADLCLLETNTSQNNSLQDMKLVLTMPTKDQCHLIVHTLPAWETVYSLQLSDHSQLAKCNTFQDSIYITEFPLNERKPDSVTTARFRCLNETDPKTRLYRILQKNKFEEAEKFAHDFQLDIELVHKVKSNYLINELSPWNVGKYDDTDQVREMIAQLMECLKTIVDDLHTAETCMTAALPTYTDTETMLAYCKTRVDKVAATKDPDVKEKLLLLSGKLLDIQHRLMTFKLAFGEEGYSGETWQRFITANLLLEALNWLDRGHLDTGFIIWTRHQAEWSSDAITVELIMQVLSTVPYDTLPTTMLGYISTGLVPLVMREVPEALELIVYYLVEKTKSMEQSDKSNWPASAISFAEFMHERLHEATAVVMDKDTCMACDNTNKTRLKCDTTLEPLYTLIQKLKQLDDVLHKYKCKLSLEKFLKETRETIAFRMLDKVVALELIAPTLERQIRPYMKEHCLNQDQIFSKYIKDLLERHGQVQSYTGKAFWEAKASAVIDCITDPEQKIEGILEVMQWASIPWSTEVEHLVNMGLKLNHNKIARLKEQCQRVHVRKMMMKYGLKNVELPSGSDAMTLVYFILTKDQLGCVDDAREILHRCGKDTLETDLYDFRMRQLIGSDRIEEGLELLRSLPTKLGMKIGAHTVTYTRVKLDFGVDIAGLEEKEHKDKQLFTEAAIHICKYLQTVVQNHLDVKDLKDEETVLMHMLALQVEYGMYPTVIQYENKDHRMKMMHTYMKDFFATKTQQTSYAKLYRFADILRINHATIQGQMAIKCANAGDIDTAVQICGELYECSPTQKTAEVLCKVVQAFLGLQAEVKADDDDVDTNKLRVLPELCHRLASQALCICELDKICQYLELCKTCVLLKSVSQQCESGDSTLSAQWGESEEFSLDKAWELYGDLSLDVFQEDALLLSSVTALPLVSQYALQNPLVPASQVTSTETEADKEEEASPVSTLCDAVIPVVQLLRDNGHLQLAFSFSIHMLYTLTQYTQQQDMGLPIYLEGQKEKLGVEKTALRNLEQSSQGMLKELVCTLIMKIFNSSRADVQLALTYLSTRSRREVMDVMMRLIKTCGSQYKKLKSIAWVGIGLGQMLKQPEVISQFQLLETNASWGYRLSKMKIPMKGSVLGPKSEKHNLLPTIAQNELADTDLVKEFCQAFELDQNCGLLLYLDHLFVTEDETGFVKKQNVEVNIARAKEAIQEIKAADELLSRIKKLYYRTSSYDYETLEFVLQEMAARSGDAGDIPVEKGLKLLEYLRVYTRRVPPSDYEMEYRPAGEKKDSQICMTALPPESKTRLPIHPLLQGDPWKIITPELRRETIDTWVLIAKLLMLSHDQICLTAVQNMVRVYSEMYTSPDGGSDMSQWHWHHEQPNFSLLEDVSLILKTIKNCESSLACAKWMVSKLPLGSEKVLVLKQCVKIAELWHLSIPEESAKRAKAKAAYLKFLKHWQKMASAQALCLHGLGDAELLQCIERPEGLIQKLYEHPSIVQTNWEAGTSKPDVHGAAEQIAEINDIQLELVQSNLIHSWLLDTSGTAQQEAETTMTFNLENLKFDDAAASRDEDEEEINFKRIVYLVQKSNQDSNLILLLEYAFKPKEGQNIISSIRALRCLLYICDDTMIETICGKSQEEMRTNLHVMIFLSSLEKLHIRHTFDTFMSCQKESLVKGIWKNHSHERTAITLVSCLCLDYKIYDLQLWVGILQRLHTYGLMRQLEYVLLRLNNVQELWSVPSLPKMWYTVLHSALDKVCPPISKKHADTCVHYFNLLLSCPVLKAVDTDSLSKDYQRLDMPACALGCLLVKKNAIDNGLQGIVTKYGKQILENITSLLESGLNHGICRKIQDMVYAYIVRAEKFAEIMNTPYQNDFISHCVRNKCVDGALVFAIRNNKIAEARGLFDIYTSTYADISMKLNRYIDDDDEEEDQDLTILILKGYLKMQKLEDVAKLL